MRTLLQLSTLIFTAFLFSALFPDQKKASYPKPATNTLPTYTSDTIKGATEFVPSKEELDSLANSMVWIEQK